MLNLRRILTERCYLPNLFARACFKLDWLCPVVHGPLLHDDGDRKRSAGRLGIGRYRGHGCDWRLRGILLRDLAVPRRILASRYESIGPESSFRLGEMVTSRSTYLITPLVQNR